MQAAIAQTQATKPSDLAVQLGTLMNHLMRTSQQDFFRQVSELELSFTQVKCLHHLAVDEAGNLSVKELAEQLGISVPAASRTLECLVQRGLAVRTEDTEDRRMKRVRITDDGRALVTSLMETRLAGLDNFVASLSEREAKRLGAALELILQREEVRASMPTPFKSDKSERSAA